MSVRTAICFLGLAACIAAPMPATADPTAGKATFQKLYDKADAAADKKDADGVVAVYSVDVVAVQKDGTQKTYADLVQGAQQIFTLVSSVSSKTVVNSCKVDGNVAAIQQTDVSKMTVPDPTGGAGFTIDDTVVSKDTWKKGDSGWKIVREVIISDDMLENGKPVQGVLGGQMPAGE